MGMSSRLYGRLRHLHAFCKDDATGTFSFRCGFSVVIVLTFALGSLVSQAVAQTPEPAAPPASPMPATSPEQPTSSVQLMHPMEPGQTSPQITLTLQDALERAHKYDPTSLSAITDANVALEDARQAKVAGLPTVSGTMDYLGTQGNGVLPTGRYVTNDGVHVYRTWAVLHQDLSPGTFMRTAYHRATSAEALARAKAEIARRGLTVTVTKDFYDLAVSQRKYATAQQAMQTAKHFFDITQDSESLGQTAHSDVVKAEIQYEQQKQAFDEATLAMENDRLNLAVLLFPALNENFSVVDDLDSAQALPQFTDIRDMAEKENPDLRVAVETLREANLDITTARTAFLPSVTVDTDYGIEANAFALHSTVAANPEKGVLPNLGYFITAHMTIPIWDWGTLRSKLRQAEYKREQAQVEMTHAQRQLLSNLYSFYNEAAVSRAAVESLRHTADLAAESLRLINLRYQAGESTALEVVDAENTLTQARNAYDDVLLRYRVALANLQTLTGSF